MPSLYTLSDWPEDRLPACNLCGITIKNGDTYGVPPGSIQIACPPCMEQPRAEQKEAEPGSAVSVQAVAQGQAQKRKAPTQPARSSVPKKRVRPQRIRTSRAYAGPERTCLWCHVIIPRRDKNRAPRTTYCCRQHFFLARSQQRQEARRDRATACPVCSKMFIPASHGTRGTQRYCSLACYTTISAVYQRKRNAERRGETWVGGVECPVCSREFLPKYRPGKEYIQKTCSRECSRQIARKLPWKTCSGCQGEYQPRRSGQIFCTSQCRRDFAAGRTPSGPAVIPWAEKYDRCVVCGTTERRHLGNGECSRCYVPKSERAGRKREKSLSQN